VPAPIVACSAYPLGYGPAAKLVVLARALRARGWEPVFLGSGIARELAARSDVFSEVIAAEGDGPEVRRRLGAANVLLSVMDRSIAAAARAAGRPYCVVDSLLWMRDHVPDVFLAAARYWVQDFPGVRARAAEVHPTPTVVGPIVPPTPRTDSGAGDELVVNLGGMESPDGPADHATRYADFVVDGVLRAALPARFGGRAVVVGGHRIVEHLRRRHGRTALAFHSLSHDESISRLARAAAVLTAPGLTTTLECFQLGVPTFFLPPENYSQWWSLHLLRAHELAPGSFHWQDRLPDRPIVERMAEATRGPRLRAVIDGIIQDESARVAYVDQLDAIPAADRAALAARQRAFFASLGPDGTETVARELTELFG
jgi:hypothetical protein